MKILAIETSCDETSAAIIEKKEEKKTVTLISNIVASSMVLHSQTGGIIPEVAAREQVKFIITVIEKAMEEAGLVFNKQTSPEFDAIAVTYGPGLIGSLLVGVETAKTLSFTWDKPLIPVSHLFGHIYANFIENKDEQNKDIKFPLIALIVSGGHTDLLLMKSHTEIQWLGGTRDDAAGECFDKSGRLLGLSYPAGPEIEQKAKLGNPKAFHFPRPLMYDKEFDFSFSGLKTAILREVQKTKKMNEEINNDLCRGLQDAIIDVLTYKTIQAAIQYSAQSILLSGGVAANQTLRESFGKKLQDEQVPIALYVPPKNLCTDNAAMIGAAALFQGEKIPWQDVAADPELYFE